MTSNDLFIELKMNNKTIRSWRLSPSHMHASIGSALGADIKVRDQNWDGIDSFVVYRDNCWWFINFNEKFEDEYQGETAISNLMTINRGPVQVVIEPHYTPRTLFQSEVTSKKENLVDFKQMRQIVVTKNGKIIESQILPLATRYTFTASSKKPIIEPPKTKSWEIKQIENFEVRQRIIDVSGQSVFSGIETDKWINNESKLSFMVVGICLLFLVGSVFITPSKEQEKKEALNAPIQITSFQTRIKKEKKVRQVKQEKTQVAANQNETPAPTQIQPTHTPSAPKTAFLSNTRLTSLLGKIAKHTANTGRHIIVNGLTPDRQNVGSAMASLGPVTKGDANAWASGDGKKFGVGTLGKGGGSSAYSGSGKLDTKGIGSGGSVGLVEEESEISGGLDREIIAQYIKTQLGQILYCYERQLSADPTLFGKVEIKFTINGNGKVLGQSISSTSLKNAMVEGCILQKVANWQFPNPDGGTQVIVTYPFMFKSMN